MTFQFGPASFRMFKKMCQKSRENIFLTHIYGTINFVRTVNSFPDTIFRPLIIPLFQQVISG